MDRSKFDWYAIAARANQSPPSEPTGFLITVLCVGCFAIGFGLGGVVSTTWRWLW